MDVYSIITLYDEGVYMFEQPSILLLIIQYLCPIKTESNHNIFEKIGSGSTSNTYKIQKRLSLTEYVLKKFHNECNFFSPIKEYSILHTLKSKYIQNFHCFYKSEGNNLGLILDFSVFSLDQLSYYQINRKEVFKSIVTSVNNAHEKGIAHGDLKPQNIYLDSYNGPAKIGDWGLAIYSEMEEKESKFVKIISTIPYRAPEIREKTYYYKGIYEKADVWSLGIILLQMCQKTLQFPVKMDFAKCESLDEKNLLKQMLDINPKTRISAKNILKHRYFQSKSST